MAGKKQISESLSTADRYRISPQLTANYLHDLTQQLADIRAALEQENYTFIKKQTHNIKGTSGTYQLDAIYEKAVELDSFADNQSGKEIADTISLIANLVEEEISRLNSETTAAAGDSQRVQISDYQPVILTVDDDTNLLNIIENNVREWGYAHRGVGNSAAMWQELERATANVILLDLKLGDEDGLTLASQLKQRFPLVPVIIITAHGTIEAAVTSVKNGVYDFVCKPLDFERLHIEINNAVEHNRLSLQVKALQGAAYQSDFHGMVGRSAAMHKIYKLIETVAPTDTSVLIIGETGTGKELAARAIHACSRRCKGPFVAVNAPAIPHELIESALFGHEKGAFTGAERQHLGFCEQADGGTLFLDEICEMEYNLQAKLLRFLENYIVQRVGTESTQAVDVRIIAATNRNPKTEIQNNKLREDLYYRLSTVKLELIPLRERHGDISLLIRYFLDLAAAKYGKNMSSVTPEAMRLFKNYQWPGNIRQLKHLISQIVITNNNTKLKVDMLPPEITKPSSVNTAVNAACTNIENNKKPDKTIPSIEEMEQRLILEALEMTSGSVPKAAGVLGINEATLYRKIKKFGLTRTFAKQ